jgi:hypothetical protein
VDHQQPILRKLPDPLGQARKRNVKTSSQMSGRSFVVGTDIENQRGLGRFEQPGECRRGDPIDAFHQVRMIL